MAPERACNQCGERYNYIGMHWSRSSSCEYPSLSQKQREIATGLLMGDGHIQRGQSRNPLIEVVMISEDYLEYIDEQFGIFGNGVTFKKSGDERAKLAKESSFTSNVCSDNYSDTYRWISMAHPELQMFADWYSTGNKAWPNDITLTPTVFKHWYCGDGNWHNSGSNDIIRIAMSNEVEYTNKVDLMFENSGLPSPNNYDIYESENGCIDCNAEFTVDQSKELWQYMGEPLPGFEYKWPAEYK